MYTSVLTDERPEGMWPGDIVAKLDWARREIGELEVVHKVLITRREVVSQRADMLVGQVAETRSELTSMGVGLKKTDSYLDRLSELLSSFRSRIGLGPKPEEELGGPSAEEEPGAEETPGAEEAGEERGES